MISERYAAICNTVGFFFVQSAPVYVKEREREREREIAWEEARQIGRYRCIVVHMPS
jgi:hypothetical protein